MKPIARLIAVFLGVEGAVYAAAIAIVMACEHLRLPWLYVAFMPVLILMAVFHMGLRIAAIGRGGPWRMLPDGDLMFARALFVLVLAIAVLFGGLSGWANVTSRLSPFAHMVLIYISLSFIAQVLLLSRGARLSTIRFGVICLLFVLVESFSMFKQSHTSRGLTLTLTMALFTAGWLLTIFRAPRYRSRASRVAPLSGALETLIVRLRGILLVRSSPTHIILQAERRGLGRLSYSLLFVCGFAYLISLSPHHRSWSAMLTFLSPDYRSLPGSYLLMLSTGLWTVAIATFGAAVRLTPRARLLWLRCANSRAQLFRVCEISALRELLLISFVAWATATGLALHHGTAVGTVEALMMLLACSAGGIAALYAGLLLPTLTGWSIAAGIAVVSLTVSLIPIGWAVALDTDAGHSILVRSLNFGVCLSACIALRTVAVQRWQEIDWTRLRPLPQLFALGAA